MATKTTSSKSSKHADAYPYADLEEELVEVLTNIIILVLRDRYGQHLRETAATAVRQRYGRHRHARPSARLDHRRLELLAVRAALPPAQEYASFGGHVSAYF
jgi:hypothetical protein